jgi:hypothetical protein
MTINDLPVGRSVDETLRLVQAFQYTDSHGEGAWGVKHRKGGRTFVADHQGNMTQCAPRDGSQGPPRYGPVTTYTQIQRDVHVSACTYSHLCIHVLARLH